MIGRSETTIGFWMTERRITVAECKVSPKSITIIKSAYGEVPPGLIQKGEIADFDSLLSFSSEVVRQINPQSKFASFNLPAGTYIIKKMPLPEDYISSNPELIKWEMRHQLLAPVDDYYFSHYYADGNSYFIAVLKDAVDQRKELLSGVGFMPVAAEPSVIALYNLFTFIEQDKKEFQNAVFLELASPYSNIALLADGVFYPGGCFVTDPGTFISAFNDSRTPGKIDGFRQDLKAHFDMVFGEMGFLQGQRFLDTLIFAGGKPSSQVAIQAETLFNSSIYLAGSLKKKKRIKTKGKLDNLTFSEIASAVGLALRMPND